VAVSAELGNRCFFALAGGQELVAPPGMNESYQEWYSRVAATFHIVLDTCNTRPYDELNSKVRDIAGQIVEARKQLFESMLASWS
jgi:hypothetical protein